ncbi:MAG: hypothetical protein R3F20_06840 [Planctomycetota bacterium]
MLSSAIPRLFVLLAALFGTVSLHAQEISEELAAKVASYLAEVDDAKAVRLLTETLAREDATGAAILELVRRAPKLEGEPARLLVPHAGQLLDIQIRRPKIEGGTKPPVLLAITPGGTDDLAARGAIIGRVPQYTPEQFGDEGRDGFMKILRATAHAAGGDPDRLWMTGFSWGGHACWDNSLHRPGAVRGFIGRGGGPRRVFYRLLDNLEGVREIAVCGGQDDPELIWNLQELERIAKKEKYDYRLFLDPERGHSWPLAGDQEAVDILLATPAPSEVPMRGRVLADGPLVEHPLFRFDEVDEKKTTVPTRIPVSARLSADEKRRQTIAKMKPAVASIRWSVKRDGDTTTLELTGASVERATVFLRAPWFTPGDRVVVKAKRKIVFQGKLEPDPRTLLEEARRTGERLRPALLRLPISF